MESYIEVTVSEGSTIIYELTELGNINESVMELCERYGADPIFITDSILNAIVNQRKDHLEMDFLPKITITEYLKPYRRIYLDDRNFIDLTCIRDCLKYLREDGIISDEITPEDVIDAFVYYCKFRKD